MHRVNYNDLQAFLLVAQERWESKLDSSALMSGTSPLAITSVPANPASASFAEAAAWPVPSCRSWIAVSQPCDAA